MMTLTKEQKETLAFLTSLSGQKDVTEALREGFSLPFAEMDAQDLNGFGSQEIRSVMAWARETVGWHHKLRKQEIYEFIRTGHAPAKAVKRLRESGYDDASTDYFRLSDAYVLDQGNPGDTPKSVPAGEPENPREPVESPEPAGEPESVEAEPVEAEATEETKTEPSMPEPKPDANQALGPFLDYLQNQLADAVDESRVEEIVNDLLDGFEPENPFGMNEIRVSVPDAEPVEVGIQHYRFEPFLRLLQTKDNDGKHLSLYLHGLPGGGKSYVCEAAAKALSVERTGSLSCSRDMSKYDLIGLFNPKKGEFEPTEFTRCVQEGGLFLLDELDRAPGSVVVFLNSLLANGRMSLPGVGTVEAHEDFRLVAGGNTAMRGKDRRFAAQPQDVASVDRFVFFEWDYDEALECVIAGFDPSELGIEQKEFPFVDEADRTKPEWADRVMSVRKAMDELDVDYVATPRATFLGIRLMEAGFPAPVVEEMVLWKGMPTETRNRIEKVAEKRTRL